MLNHSTKRAEFQTWVVDVPTSKSSSALHKWSKCETSHDVDGTGARYEILCCGKGGHAPQC